MTTSTATADTALAVHQRFLLDDFPKLNMAAVHGELAPNDFLHKLAGPLASVRAAAAVLDVDEHAARDLLTELGFLINAAERHFRAAGASPGTALRQMPGAERVLLSLGGVADHPPIFSAYCYWPWNKRPFSFTGDTQERLFHDVVVGTVENVARIADELRFLADTSHLDDREAVECVRAMTQAHVAAYDLLRMLAPRTAFSGEFFTFVYRTFLLPCPVAGRLRDGASAANFASFWLVDLRLTGPTPFYTKYLAQRIHTVPGGEAQVVRAALEEESVLDNVLRHLAIHADEGAITPQAMDIRVARAGIAPFLVALKELVASITRWTKVHLALVRDKLERPAAEAQAKPVIPANKGSSGTADWHQELPKILEMRADCPVLKALFESAQRVQRAGD